MRRLTRGDRGDRATCGAFVLRARKVLDKRDNRKIARELGIPCTAQFELESIDQSPEAIDHLGFPVVLKDPGPFVQEFVSGASRNVLRGGVPPTATPRGRARAVLGYLSAFRPGIGSDVFRLDDPISELLEHWRGFRESSAWPLRRRGLVRP